MKKTRIIEIFVEFTSGWGWTQRLSAGSELKGIEMHPVQHYFESAIAVTLDEQIQYIYIDKISDDIAFGIKLIIWPMHDEKPLLSELGFQTARLIFGNKIIESDSCRLIKRIVDHSELFEYPVTYGYANYVRYMLPEKKN